MLAAIELLRNEHHDRLRVAIVVPTKVLASQWKDEIVKGLRVQPGRIGEMHSDATSGWKSPQCVLIAVVNSARDQLPPILDEWSRHRLHTLLIVDECHRLGSGHNARVFEGKYDFSLGLSATPERADGGHKEHVYPALGAPIFRYPLLNALDDGVLAPVLSLNLYVDFKPWERAKWEDLGKEISLALTRLRAESPDLRGALTAELFDHVHRLAKEHHPGALRLLGLISERRGLVAQAEDRVACQQALLDWLGETGRRALVFHETIETAENSADWLRHIDVATSLDHSGLPKDKRRIAMRRFRSGQSQVLVAVRALDEGIDVPEASVAIIAAGSRTRRQRIQRIGRVLRAVEGKQALVMTLLVRGTPEESEVGGADALLLGAQRVRHHRWPHRPLHDALGDSASSYTPDKAAPTDADRATFHDIPVQGPTQTKSSRIAVRAARPAPGRFSINAWHDADEVRDALMIPAPEFERARRHVRKAFRRKLGLPNDDRTRVHGTEIEAIAREYERTDG